MRVLTWVKVANILWKVKYIITFKSNIKLMSIDLRDCVYKNIFFKYFCPKNRCKIEILKLSPIQSIHAQFI